MLSKFSVPRPICFRLLTHWVRRAASRAACTAGSKSAIRTAMIAITTSNSISVKPRLSVVLTDFIVHSMRRGVRPRSKVRYQRFRPTSAAMPTGQSVRLKGGRVLLSFLTSASSRGWAMSK